MINWERKFEIKAKDEYIGGNNVMTNVPNDSRVVAEDDDRTITEAFPKPVVNVRIELKAGEARDQIFLGQSLEKYFDDGTDNDFKNLFDIRSDVKYLEDVNNLIYSWDVEGKDRQYGSPNEFIELSILFSRLTLIKLTIAISLSDCLKMDWPSFTS